MAQQVINIGATADDHTGDPIRTSFNKTNQNFTELYSSSGGITAGSTPTTGFTAGQLMLSDGTVTQAWRHNVTAQFGDATYPLSITPHTVPDGIYAQFQFSSGGCSVYLFADQTVGTAGIEMPGGSNGGIYTQNSFFGFTTGTNSSTYSPDTALTAIQYATAAIRCLESPTTAAAFRVYNTFTNFTNGEWGALDWVTTPNTLTIGSQANGTGAVRAVNIVGSALTFNGSAISGAPSGPASGDLAGTYPAPTVTAARFATPGPVGSTTASTGRFTTLAATGALTPAQVAGIVGTTANNNASAGSVGEVISANVAAAAAVTITNNVAINITSVTLTAGDWDVRGEIWVNIGTGGATNAQASLNTTTGALSTDSSIATSRWTRQATIPASTAQVGGLRPCRASLAGSTTYYLVALVAFPSGACSGYGNIIARRAR